MPVRPCWCPARAGLLAARVAAAALLVAGVALGAASSAAAHAALIGSAPAAGSTVDVPPGAVTLVFAEPVQDQFAQVAVLDEAGRSYVSGSYQVAHATVTQPVTGLGPGRYQVSYRVVSVDGHPVSGAFPFVVSPAAVPAAPAAATPPAATPRQGDAAPGAATRGTPSTAPTSSSPTATPATIQADAATSVASRDVRWGWLGAFSLAAAAIGAVAFAMSRRAGRPRPPRH